MNDGNIVWTGGMNSSLPPYVLREDQYSRGCNVMLNRHSGQLTNRHGFEVARLVGSSACLYHEAKNFQASGYYFDGSRYIQLKLVDGWLLSFTPTIGNEFQVKLLNPEDRRSSVVSKAWITTVPNGAIVQDGLGLPHFVKGAEVTRSKGPNYSQVGVGKMGVYVQNRYFYVDPTSKYIKFSDPLNPYSILNSQLINLYGFALPEDQSVITAIGVRAQNLNYVDGGVLSFASYNSVYSTDVRGDAQNWEDGSTSLGKVQESLPGAGAVSSYSYESFASNLYFRAIEGGLVDVAYAESQFGSGAISTGVSSEVLDWFDRDTKRLLSRCYTKRFGHRILTTTGPQFSADGYVYWNGLIVLQPNGLDGRTPLYDGLWTGVRPWALTSYSSQLDGDALWVDSYDSDGVTRLYQLNIRLNRDVGPEGPVEMGSWLETRAYSFDALPQTKKVEQRSYSVSDLPRDLDVEAYSRPDLGAWSKFHEATHYVPRLAKVPNDFGVPLWSVTNSGGPQQRLKVNMKSEHPERNRCYSRQYRLEFSGAYGLQHLLLRASPDQENEAVSPPEKNIENPLDTPQLMDYNYSIT